MDETDQFNLAELSVELCVKPVVCCRRVCIKMDTVWCFTNGMYLRVILAFDSDLNNDTHTYDNCRRKRTRLPVLPSRARISRWREETRRRRSRFVPGFQGW